MFIQRKFKGRNFDEISIEESEIIVLTGWVMVMVLSTIPVMILGKLNFSQSFFETVSAWTTTGLSVVDVEKAPKLLLFWRSLMQLAGGAGLAIIMVSALIGTSGTGMSISEGRQEQLVPQVKRSAALVLRIYLGITLLGVFAYLFFGMDLFDAVNHSFAAVSTGGFSTKSQSIGFWNSPQIEATSMIIMFLGNLNFVTTWLFLRGKFDAFYKNGEVRLFFILTVIAAFAIAAFTTVHLYSGLGKALRVAVFETVSALTTTGFSTVPYTDWNATGIFVMILLMIVGGGSCSTAGGIKQIRVWILLQQIRVELKRLFLPSRAVVEVEIQQGENLQVYTDKSFRSLCVFMGLYLMTFGAGTLVLIMNGIPTHHAMFEFASSLGTVGLSIGVTSPGMSMSILWVEVLGMIMGRLEFFVVIVAISRILIDFQAYIANAFSERNRKLTELKATYRKKAGIG
ncbi:MAG: TrkH family potassium uptake protein [Candidatus Riflebacteria bacterium]